MIKEFSSRPKPQNNNAKIALTVLILLSVLSSVWYCVAQTKKGLIGMLAVFSIGLLVFVLTKYILSYYSYDITLTNDGEALFVVTQITGKRKTTLCRISLSDIVSVEKRTKAKNVEKKAEQGIKKYSYCPTLFPKEVYVIAQRTRYERSEITIEATDSLAELLISYSKEAKELSAEDEE